MKTEDKLIEKAKEAFVMSIEIYNKPSIKYRVEGFSFFICNAWELMLKAHMIKTKGDNSIYFADNPKRTIPLETCIKEIFTNEKSPIRMNLSKIIELRNTSTHFIVEEYEMVYIPLFQACVFNFIEKMQEFHGVDMTTIIPQNFLTLTVSMRSLNENEIRAKYSDQVAEKLLSSQKEIETMVGANNHNFAIRIDHYDYLTKDKNKATEVVYIDKNADKPAKIIKELKDPNVTHKYNMKACIKEINARLNRQKIQLLYKGEEKPFNSFHFDLFCKYFDIKSNDKFCYPFTINTTPSYGYSIQAIDFIVDEIKKNPTGIIEDLRQKVKK